ncbi:MAG TPA: D-2-hydroxyacid dehydrogenase [Dehalococcoidia bacterium]|nr:D-2-hydroxyacid dehydrogenase [Dehalococcoidia bacterium]
MVDQIVVLDGYTLNPGDISWSGLEEFGDLVVHDRSPEDATLDRAAGCRFVLTNKVPLSDATMEQLPDLQYIGVLATGYNVVDVEAAKRRGIVVTNVPTYGTDSVAQHATALLLELVRQPALHAAAVRDGAWSESIDWCFSLAPITELSGKTLGIVGIGRIGRALARIGAAMGMSILAHDEYPPDAATLAGLDVEFTEMDDLFRRADAISLHCPLTSATEHLVNAERLALMKPTAVLLNTSRGPLVDNQALAEALEAGQIAGAGLDVLDVEPPPIDNPLLRAPHCIITPHVAWYAQASRQRLMDIAVENVRAFVAGTPENTVG